MFNILRIFLILNFLFALTIIGIGKIAWHREDVDIDSQYLNEDGDHIYYDRSLIEKKTFRKIFPDITNLRSFSRLFSHEK